MRCISPLRIPIKENGKITGYREVPCMSCIACEENYKDNWAFRAKLELGQHKKAVMLTFTYAPLFLGLQNLEYDDGTKNSLQIEVFQLMMKRLRKALGDDKVRFFASGEYGDENFTRRPHYHVILFGIDEDNKIFDGKVPVYKDNKIDHWYLQNGLSNVWRYGEVEISHGQVDEKSIRYCTKYTAKRKGNMANKDYYKVRCIHPEFILMSRKPGIGFYGIKANADYFLNNSFGRVGNRKIGLSRYIIDKVSEFTDTDFKGYLDWKSAEYRKTHKKDFNSKQYERNLNAKFKK